MRNYYIDKKKLKMRRKIEKNSIADNNSILAPANNNTNDYYSFGLSCTFYDL